MFKNRIIAITVFLFSIFFVHGCQQYSQIGGTNPIPDDSGRRAPSLDFSDTDSPQFYGHITKITIPVQPAYTPGQFRTKMSMVTDEIVRENHKNSRNKFNVESVYKFRIDKIGDTLLSEGTISGMKANGQVLNLPSNNFRMLMDEHGKVGDVELNMAPIGNVEKRQWDQFLDKLSEQLKEMTVSLPEMPVKTGDCWSKVSRYKLLDFLPKHPDDKDFESIVQGWSYRDERRVLVVSMNEHHTVYPEKNGGIQIKADGYSLIDPETFQAVESVLFVYYETPPVQADGRSGKIIVHQTTEILK